MKNCRNNTENIFDKLIYQGYKCKKYTKNYDFYSDSIIIPLSNSRRFV